MNRFFILVPGYYGQILYRLYSRCEIWAERDVFLSQPGITVGDLSNDIDTLAYSILKLPITFYIEQYVDHRNVIDVF